MSGVECEMIPGCKGCEFCNVRRRRAATGLVDVDRHAVEWSNAARVEFARAASMRGGRTRAELRAAGELWAFERRECAAFLYDMASILVRGPAFAASMFAVARGVSLTCSHDHAQGESCACGYARSLAESLVVSAALGAALLSLPALAQL